MAQVGFGWADHVSELARVASIPRCYPPGNIALTVRFTCRPKPGIQPMHHATMTTIVTSSHRSKTVSSSTGATAPGTKNDGSGNDGRNDRKHGLVLGFIGTLPGLITAVAALITAIGAPSSAAPSSRAIRGIAVPNGRRSPQRPPVAYTAVNRTALISTRICGDNTSARMWSTTVVPPRRRSRSPAVLPSSAVFLASAVAAGRRAGAYGRRWTR
jgi:hypothetical protein